MRVHSTIGVRSGHATHVGNRRDRNEDAVIADTHVFAVADGMGGHERGDVAAQIATRCLRGLGHDRSVHRSHLLDRIRASHAEIRASSPHPAATMGTTLSGLALIEDPISEVLIFNVGDSRVYRLRNGVLELLTHDHSVVQELIDRGDLASDDAKRHPDRHVITRSLGSPVPLTIDWALESTQARDRYLISSDGLTNELSIDRLTAALSTSDNPQDAADELIRLTLEGAAIDNVSAVVVDVTHVSTARHNGTTDDPLTADTAPSSPTTSSSVDPMLTGITQKGADV